MTALPLTELILLSGAPGSGKTTVARLLAEQYERCVNIHTDDFWHMITRGAIAPYLPESDEQNQTVVSACAAAALGYAAGGFTTIVDGVIGPWMLHHYQRAARHHPEVRLHYVVLQADRATTLQRAQQRTDAGALVDEAPILAMWDQFENLGELSVHSLDTTQYNAVETVNHVSDALARNAFSIS